MNGGELNVHFTNSVLVTLVVALFVLWRYRLAILGGMMQGDPRPLPLPETGDGSRMRFGAGELAAREAAASRRIVAGWLLTTAICGLPMAMVYVTAAGFGYSPTYLLGVTMSYMLPALPIIAVSLAWPPLRIIGRLGVALLGAVAIFLLAGCIERALHGRPLSWQILGLGPLFFDIAWNQLWMAGFFCLFSWPTRLRGVVPITFAALMVFGLAPLAGSQLTAALAATESGTPWVLALGQDGVFVLIALPAGWLAWLRLRKLAGDYEAKRFSDAQLLARTWWLMLVVSIGFDIFIGRERQGLAVALVIGEILLFGPLNTALMKRLGSAGQGPGGQAPTLLLLRVFGYTARIERLFDRIASRWRLIGPVTMIAAPDVAARTLDAGDYLRWLTGRIDTSFVTSQASLDARLASLDQLPDPDGRYRINEFCCRESSWQATVVELMHRADAVIMDLRGMTGMRGGCTFELQQLARRLPPQRVVLVVDQTTEKSALQDAFGPGLDKVGMVEVHAGRDVNRAFSALLASVASAVISPVQAGRRF